MTGPLENEAEDWPREGIQTLGHCPVCGSERRQPLYTGLRDRIFDCAPGEWTLQGCGNCGSGYLDPRPTEATMHLAYQEYYTHRTESLAADQLSGYRLAQRKLANGFKNWRFATDLQPSTKLGIVAALLVPGLRRLLDRQFRHLGKGGGRVLDIGFGDGGFLRNATAMGWTAEGTDFDPVLIANARRRGLSVIEGTIDETDGSFDCITLCHTIEHFHDPIGILRRCHERLRPGGTIWIETPNIQSLGLRRFGADWRGLEPPRHLVLFSRRSLIDALTAIGFTNVRDLPQPGVVKGIYALSENIRRRREPTAVPRASWKMRVEMMSAGVVEHFAPARREFLGIAATKDRNA